MQENKPKELSIEQLRDEAQRLAQAEISLLQEMLEIEGLLVEETQQSQSLNRTSAQQAIEILKDEQKKLENFDMIIAVVGTMKAGKSTTINAIVGSEVLPNRNRPMTALPTLIRHTKGQTIPVLKFENNQPVNELIGKLDKEIQKQDQLEKVEILCQSDPDMKVLIEFISSKNVYKNQYQGSDEIFDFLRGLNDLVRLSREIEIDFPFEKYTSMNQFPIIEIEFVHLKETDSNQGRLSLLDTPGPNEAGQPHLRKMMREQLQKASAVLAVLDYTQLKSDADSEVRKELQEIADTSKNRLYAIVNKFDQEDTRGDDEENIKNFIYLDLMKKKIKNDNIFPVSSKWAYLANRAKHEITLNNSLPDFEKEDWVQDFAKPTLGLSWKGKINDREEIVRAIKDLWTSSRFELPLKKVIETAHSRAAIFAIDSTAAKLLNFSEKISNLINIRETALTKSTEDLKSAIENLRQSIQKITAFESEYTSKVLNKIDLTKQEIKKVLEESKKTATEKIDFFFREGEKIEYQKRKAIDNVLEKIKEMKNSLDENHQEEIKNELTSISEYFSGQQEISKKIQEAIKKTQELSKKTKPFYQKNLRQIEKIILSIKAILSIKDSVSGSFQKKETAEQILEKIGNYFPEMINDHIKTINNEVKKMLSEMDNFYTELKSETESIITEMERNSKKDGFEIKISIPKPPELKFITLDGEVFDNSLLEQKSEKYDKKERANGIWGTICKWFGTEEWGFKIVQEEKIYYKLKKEPLEEKFNNEIKKTFDLIENELSEKIEEPIKKDLEEFFFTLTGKTKEIHGDFLQSLQDKNYEKTVQENLLAHLEKLKTKNKITEDSKSLKGDVENLIEQ